MPVTAIGEEAFRGKKLTGVKIPNGVRRIGYDAFYANEIERIVIPDTVTEIGGGVFAYNKITEIVFPAGITGISRYMFAGNKLTSITIPESVSSIGEGAFENNMLTEIVISGKVHSIGSKAFGSDNYSSNRNNITKVTIGDNVELDLAAIKRFTLFYEYAVRKKGGTYIYSSDNYWIPEDKNIPVYRFAPEDGWKSPDINFLADMPDLEQLSLRDNDLLIDITPLSGLTKIKNLLIYDCQNIETLKPLSSLVNLESLSITHNKNYDYSALAPLRNLEALIIYCDPSGEIDLGSIGRLRYLKSLQLGNILKAVTIKNINELHNLTNLETLEITCVADLDLSWAHGGFHNLTELNLICCSVKDVSPLANLPNLVEVDLAGCSIKDITPLLRSNSIKYVKVYEDYVEGGISDNIRSRFEQKGIYLDTFRDTR
jgi:Leucine-rich repeat (LRR) protein